MPDLDAQIANIVQDYADGLHDSIEDAVEAIKELPPFKEYVAKNETWLRATKGSHSIRGPNRS